MGRKVMRVPLDFNWPLHKVWHGYMNPYIGYSWRCEACGGTGDNAAVRRLGDDWYGFERASARWCDNITQDEVDALVAHNRLWDFTRQFVPGKGWQDKNPPYHPTAEEVNAWSKRTPGHDGINRWICVEARAKRLGVWGVCEVCQGEGEFWAAEKYKQLAEAWREEEPPTGEGWQVWETVSDGSPISPVFPTQAALQQYLVEQGYSATAAHQFVEDGSSVTLVSINGRVMDGIAALDERDK